MGIEETAIGSLRGAAGTQKVSGNVILTEVLRALDSAAGCDGRLLGLALREESQTEFKLLQSEGAAKN